MQSLFNTTNGREQDKAVKDDALYVADALEVLRTLPDNSVDALITDPPASINFMGKEWDSDKGGRTEWIIWLTLILEEAWRVLKPGAYALVWSIPRRSHWTALALENAGYEIRDSMYHIFGSGFPKSTDIAKQIDKRAGATREVIGVNEDYVRRKPHGMKTAGATAYNYSKAQQETNSDITAPATPEAQQWDGWGTCLKPAVEVWWLCRKPLAEDTVTGNVLEWGTGALHVGACRVGIADDMKASDFDDSKRTSPKFSGVLNGGKEGQFRNGTGGVPDGRFPAHLVFSHSPLCTPLGTKRVKTTAPPGKPTRGQKAPDTGAAYHLPINPKHPGYADVDGMEEVAAWECDPSCPVAQLDGQSGNRKSGGGVKAKAGHTIGFLRGEDNYHFQHDSAAAMPSEGGASRFFTQLEADEWQCDPSCPVYQLDQQSGILATHPKGPQYERDYYANGAVGSKDTGRIYGHFQGGSKPMNEGSKGGASRFYTQLEADLDGMTPFRYQSKPARSERNAGLEGLPAKSVPHAGHGNNETDDVTARFVTKPQANHHPTVKSVPLMRWFIKLVTPPGGVVLDCFCGSGSTLVAAVYEGHSFVGIDNDEGYARIAQARVKEAYKKVTANGSSSAKSGTAS